MVEGPVCDRCAAKIPEIPGSAATCHRCRKDKVRFDYTFAMGRYEGLLSELLLRMKSDRSEQLAHSFGKMLTIRFRDRLRQNLPDAIVPIPSSPWRRLYNGTNSSNALATVLSGLLNVPVVRLLWKNPNTRRQLGLSRVGRIRNMRGGLRLKAGYHLENPHMLIVDDVMTTGATCSEATKVLKRAGASRVSVMVVARTYDD